MKDLITKFQALPKKYQILIVLIVFIVGMVLLPNTIVYAVGILASYKLINKQAWKYTAVSILSVITFFSGILWIAGDTQTIENGSVAQTQTENIKKTVTQEQEFIDVDSIIDELSLKDEEDKSSSTELPTETNQNWVVETSPAPQTQTVQTEQPQAPSVQTYSVARIVDGDTVDLNIKGKVERVRLIGIDTPETVHPSKPVECFGMEATNKAKSLLEGKQVQLVVDPSQGERDFFGRLLGYIILPDGRDFGKVMIQDGYAYEYTYGTAYKNQVEYKQAQQYAEINNMGLWAPGVCEDWGSDQQDQSSTTGTSKWYVSSHHSSQYYYCEESDGWKNLSESFLKTYDTEAELKKDYPNHTLHYSCQ